MSAPAPVLILKTGRYAIHHGQLGIIRSLGRLGIPVYTVAEDHLTPAATSRYLTGSFVWHAGDLPRPQQLEALAKIGKYLNRPTILIPTDDLGAILVGEESATLRQWFVFPDIPAGLPRKLANKQTLYTLCRQIGVACPNTLCPTSISDVHEFALAGKFPIVVKPAAGWLHRKPRVSIVHSEQELVDAWHWAGGSQIPNLLLQEYIPPGADWFFHGYCNGASDCLAGFTGMKLRSYPPHAGITTLGRSITNDVLAISYAGIMDLDFRFDERDQKYKLLDFNPRIGAQFRVFVDGDGLDVARVLYRDLAGQIVRRSGQVDGRVFVVESEDLRASVNYARRSELSAYAWLQSFKGRKEFAWFSWDDPLPFLTVSARIAIRGVGKILRIRPSKANASRLALAKGANRIRRCRLRDTVPV
jgi:D-aspartate ligase